MMCEECNTAHSQETWDYKCQYCGEESPGNTWCYGGSKCPLCGEKYDYLMAQDSEE